MKCELCGKDYKALGVHLVVKHKVDLREYKEEFGIQYSTKLVDDELHEYLSAKAKYRIENDQSLKDELKEQCLINSKNRNRVKGMMSDVARNKLSERNAEDHKNRLVSLAPEVKKILDEKKCILDVRREIGMGRNAALKIVNLGLAQYDKDTAMVVGTLRRVESRARNKQR